MGPNISTFGLETRHFLCSNGATVTNLHSVNYLWHSEAAEKQSNNYNNYYLGYLGAYGTKMVALLSVIAVSVTRRYVDILHVCLYTVSIY